MIFLLRCPMFWMLIAGLMSAGTGCGESEKKPAEPVETPEVQQASSAFADTSLEAAVRQALKKPAGPLTQAELLSLTQLVARGQGIASLAGIDSLKNLQVLDLADNHIQDLSPLSGLTKLTYLDLENNQVQDLSVLAALKRLQTLNLSFNAVQDLSPLVDLGELRSVELTGNPLSATSLNRHLPALQERGVQVVLNVVQAPVDSISLLPAELRNLRGRIVFSSNRAGNYDIFVMEANGSEVFSLTDDLQDERQPVWSPDGRRIAFVRGGNRGDIFTTDAEGRDPVDLTRGQGDNRDPAWSPDGTRIAFVRSTEGTYKNLHIMAADGSQVVRLSEYPADERHPSWSPDGERIVFDSRRGPTKPGIYAMDLDSHEVVRLTSDAMDMRTPRWSPDGTKIALVGDVVKGDGYSWRIFTIKADGADPVQISQDYDLSPAWSPDGSKIVFCRFMGVDPEQCDLFAMDPDGRNPVNLTRSAEDNQDPSWTFGE